jgi:transposase InsO family protein
LGGKRGRLTSEQEREIAVPLILESLKSGARLKKACAIIEISIRTFQRWTRGHLFDKRKGAFKRVGNKLSNEERRLIIETACNEEFSAMTPMEIVPTLAERGIYIASESTFYRLLKAHHLQHHRSNVTAPRYHARPLELVATGPNQVYSWDITYVRTTVRGIYFFAYIVVDIFSRKIVCWEIGLSESDETSAAMMERLNRECLLRGIYLHSDNGNPMRGSTMVMTLLRLGVIPSLSRPRVSDDNPFSEALFKTIKYHKSYPGKFETITEARLWFSDFINWYNTEHLHSGIGYVTPNQRHNGTAKIVYDKRNQTYLKAKEAHPERWSGKAKEWKGPKQVLLNPSSESRLEKAS